MKTAVSVIIPYYFGQAFVPQLLQMMDNNAERLYQETSEKIEVLFVNDSPGEEIIITGEHPYEIKIITNSRNCGIHASRVNGLKEARGKWVLFLDQDDKITNDCLFSQIRHIGIADMVIGNGIEGKPNGQSRLIFETDQEQACAMKLSCHYFYNNLIRSPGQVLIRKSSIPEYWTRHVLKNNGSDDAFLWILMFCNHCRAVKNDDIVYEHVFTGRNASGNDSAMLQSQMEVADKLKGIASKHGLWAFCRRAEYYCTSGTAHRLRYLDVGICRKAYSVLHMRTPGKEQIK